MDVINELSKLENPTLEFLDPEDFEDGSGAKLIDNTGYDDDYEAAGGTFNSLRKKPISLEHEKRYAGQTVTRSALDSDNSFEEEESDDSEDDDMDDAVLKKFTEKVQANKFLKHHMSEKPSASNKGVGDGDDDVHADDSDDEVDGVIEDNDDDDDDDDDNADESGSEEGSNSLIDPSMYLIEASDGEIEEESSDEESSDNEGNMGQGLLEQPGAKTDLQKAFAVRSQLGMYDDLLKLRMAEQKILASVNRLPQPDMFEKYVKESDTAYQNDLTNVQTEIMVLLNKCIQLKEILIQQNKEVNKELSSYKSDSAAVVPNGIRGNKRHCSGMKEDVDDDEEITSESEIEDEEVPKPPMKKLKTDVPRKSHKLDDFPSLLVKHHEEFKKYRNNTIQKWYTKTQISSGKLNKSFNAFEKSALKQIEQIMGDKERLVKRTQLKRSSYHILASKDDTSHSNAFENETCEGQEIQPLPSREHLKDYNKEIFDDDDFYHQLLRELIARKASETNDPTAISRQWLELQKARNKTKRSIDLKAGKDKKIRYHIHPKMVSFMAPYDNIKHTDEAMDELFGSLFGQNHHTSKD